MTDRPILAPRDGETFIADEVVVASAVLNPDNVDERQAAVVVDITGHWNHGANDHLQVILPAMSLQHGAAHIGLNVTMGAHDALLTLAQLEASEPT